MAFHVTFSFTPTIPEDTIVVFDEVNVNLGNEYNSETGIFTVLTGAAGLYFFYVHFLNDDGKKNVVQIRKNGLIVSSAYADENLGGDYPVNSAGAVIILDKGKQKSFKNVQILQSSD